jgi:hypothetical protein
MTVLIPLYRISYKYRFRNSDTTHREADTGIRKTGDSPSGRSGGVSQSAASLLRLTTTTTSAMEKEAGCAYLTMVEGLELCSQTFTTRT